MGGALLSKPWRPLPENNQANLNFVKSYQPRNKEVKHLRILLHGPLGAAKSSFINSVESVLRNRVSGRALTDAISGSSFTKQYKTFKIHKDEKDFYSIVFTDIMGFEQHRGVKVEDVTMALRGHVKDGHKFNPDSQLNETDEGYNSSPTVDDKVHVLVSVIPADKVSILSEEVVMKMREVRQQASEMGIPQVAVLTKVDQACPKVKEDMKNVYKSKYLLEQVEKFHGLLGLPLNCIFLVKNYETDNEINETINMVILMALRQMINYGEDFLNNL